MTRLFAWLIFICLGGCSAVDSPVAPESQTTQPVPAGRLPASVLPLAYRLDLTIVPQRDRFSGNVTIALDIREPLGQFYLHAAGLTVNQTLLRLADGSTLTADFVTTPVEGVASVVLPRVVAAQRAEIEIDYHAAFGEKLKGLYRVRDDGEAYAFTQFEPISAREAFPCFDEPAFKTPFYIVLNVARNHTAVTATGEVERLELENGLTRRRYATTPPLPTYLIAFAVGPLDVVPAPPVPATGLRPVPLPLRGIAAAGKGAKLGHALGTTPELLLLLEDYFDSAHPYPKLDIIAVPDFGSGAMENVGALTYRESLLLIADDAPALQRRRHALVHAHEMAHQWFGNLVTMPWWDDIWLNEAFASWMAYKIVAQWNPAHRAELSRLQRIAFAMREDALSTARQVRQPVESNHDIENAFDSITYAKGGAVLTMFERYLGEERFREGVRSHMRRFAHGNADVNDFIASLAAVGGERVGEAMRSFLFQPGIPLLEVAVDCSDGPVVTVRQSRYRPIGSDSAAGTGWTIPFCMRYGDAGETHEVCELLGPGEQAVALDTESCPDWLLPNAGFSGYYHWLLPVADYPALIAAGKSLSATEELAIADSIDAGLASGRFSVGEAADLLARLAQSERPQVALAPRDLIEHARDRLIAGEAGRESLLGYTRALYVDLPVDRVFDPGFMANLPDDSRRLFLVDVAELLAESGDGVVREQALERASDWIDGSTGRLPADSVGLALAVAVGEGGAPVIDRLLQRLGASRDGQERQIILGALAHATAPADAERLRDLLLSETIRTNEIRGFLRDHIKFGFNRLATWNWLEQQFDPLVERLPPRDAGRLPAELAAQLCDEALADRAAAFLAPRMASLPGGPRNVAKAIETIRLCARRTAVQRPQAEAYFQTTGPIRK